MKPIRVLLADDHILVRAGIRALLQGFAGVQIVAEAGDGHEALALVEAQCPHLVLMDIAMPGLNGIDAMARIVKDFPETRVIILSMNAAEQYVLQAMRAGAAGYLLKNTSPAELEQAVRSVARGETYLSPAISGHVIGGLLRGGTEAAPGERLTARQREVLQLIAEGHTTKEIARKLGLSVKTVETHRQQLMERLDIHEVAGLVRHAMKIGLIGPEA